MPRTIRAVGAAGMAVLVLLLGACGPGGATTHVRSGPPGGAAATAGRQSVSLGSATFEVPAAWPVYDLTATPHRCARFDIHAVYRGHQAADAACPARALGRTEAVQVEPNDQYAKARVLPSDSAATINGQAVSYESGGEASHQIVATFPGLGVVVRVTYGTDAALAQQIVASVGKAGA